MANRAAEELKALDQDVNQVEDAATALERIMPDEAAQQAPGDDAEFGTPEAIATAVFASVLLGPVGGVLVGGAQGWLKKRSDQALLDKIADQQNILTSAGDIYSDQLSAFRASAVNDNDLEQVDKMQSSLDVAREFMGSADKELRSQGVAIMNGVNQEMNGYARNQETDRVALETQIKADKRQLGLDEYSRYASMQTDFDTQSAPWLSRKEAGATVIASLNGGSAAQIHAAMILFNKTLDPNSAVLGEERDAISSFGTLLDTVYNFFGEKFTGQKLNADQRRDIGKATLTILEQSTEFQLAREGRFAERAIDDLPVEYLDRFSLVDDTPGADPLNIPPDAKNVIASVPSMVGETRERFEQFIVKEGDMATAQAANDARAIRDYLGDVGDMTSDGIKAGIEAFKRDINRGVQFIRRPTN